ncbi:hypothetical protein [Vibrio coralliirubri]|uniref:hypothetical protein n=1 Tax=Vibrio coralliirubri TaxID=1516159 RepID=UPI00067E8225|nr:hypothetical protein [Vibrio coralliirubri]
MRTKAIYQCSDCGNFTTTVLDETPNRPCGSCGGDYTWQLYQTKTRARRKSQHRQVNRFENGTGRKVATWLFWICFAIFAISFMNQL